MDTDVAVFVVDGDEAEGCEPGTTDVVGIDEVTVGCRELAVSLVGEVVGIDDETGAERAVPDAGEGDFLEGAFPPQGDECAEALGPAGGRRHGGVIGGKVVADADEFVHLLRFEGEAGVLEARGVGTLADGERRLGGAW